MEIGVEAVPMGLRSLLEQPVKLFLPRRWRQLLEPSNEPALAILLGPEAQCQADQLGRVLGDWCRQLLRHPSVGPVLRLTLGRKPHVISSATAGDETTNSATARVSARAEEEDRLTVVPALSFMPLSDFEQRRFEEYIPGANTTADTATSTTVTDTTVAATFTPTALPDTTDESNHFGIPAARVVTSLPTTIPRTPSRSDRSEPGVGLQARRRRSIDYRPWASAAVTVEAGVGVEPRDTGLIGARMPSGSFHGCLFEILQVSIHDLTKVLRLRSLTT